MTSLYFVPPGSAQLNTAPGPFPPWSVSALSASVFLTDDSRGLRGNAASRARNPDWAARGRPVPSAVWCNNGHFITKASLSPTLHSLFMGNIWGSLQFLRHKIRPCAAEATTALRPLHPHRPHPRGRPLKPPQFSQQNRSYIKLKYRGLINKRKNAPRPQKVFQPFLFFFLILAHSCNTTLLWGRYSNMYQP